jgi:ribonuclease BN (tRNA processing enzyme)
MDVFFIGVGDACDPQHGNTSVHVRTSSGFNILCDCGFSVPHNYFAFSDNPDQLDLVWVSHFHGDHFFGLPLLILRFWEMGREKPLLVAGQAATADRILNAMDLAYPGFRKKLGYELRFMEIEPDGDRHIEDITCRTVETDHSQRNLGLLVDDGDKRFYYSGDGRPTRRVAELVRNCDLAVHEAFGLEEEVHNHGSVSGCLQLAEKNGIRHLALVHIDRKVRRGELAAIRQMIGANPSVMLPEAGMQLVL